MATRHFAFEGGVTTDATRSDTVRITSGQYLEAIDAVTSGRMVTINDGFKIVDPPQEPSEAQPDQEAPE